MTLSQDHRSDILVESIIGLAHRLGLTVVAEGVETQAQWDFLAACACDFAQGYLIGRPQAPEHAGEWLIPEARLYPPR